MKKIGSNKKNTYICISYPEHNLFTLETNIY